VKKDPLGRGLLAILQDLEEKGAVRLVPLDHIEPNASQPRLTFREESLAELAASIQAKGVLQPILLRKRERKFEIIAGERRYRAARMVGLLEIPAIVKDVDDGEAVEISLIENLQREDLTPLEVAATYQRFIDHFAYTQEELALKLGIDRSTVANTLRLLKLPEWIKDLLAEGKLTQGHARVLLSLNGESDRRRFVEKVMREGMTVRELEGAVRSRSKARKPRSQFASAEESLRATLQTRVNVDFRGKKGKIIIEFYSAEDLARLVELISNRS
jgi:ParB family transcriptional regulator, chromosome partitioning protein